MRAPVLVDVPALLPGRCYGCGSINGPLVDTMVDVPFEGRIYLCVATCVATYATLAGFVPQADLDAAQEELAGSLADVAVRDAELEALRAEQTKVVELDAVRALLDERLPKRPGPKPKAA